MNDNASRDDEANRFSRRLQRYAQVGTNVGGVAAGMATRYVLGLDARPREERGRRSPVRSAASRGR